jgi:hypothetical protein
MLNIVILSIAIALLILLTGCRYKTITLRSTKLLRLRVLISKVL